MFGLNKTATTRLLIVTIALGLVTGWAYSTFAGTLTKQESFSHSVTENGTIQVRLVTSYLDDGKLIDKKVGPPMTPADTSKMSEWDQKSQDIVTAITDKTVTDTFKVEHETSTGTGLETIVTYDRTIDDLGRISVRRITRVFDEGVIVSKKFHRSWIMPGQDASKADVMSKAVAEKIHTQAVIDAYNAKMAELVPPIAVEPK